MAVSGSAEEICCVFGLFIYTFTMLEVAFALAISLHCASASPLFLHNVLLSRAVNTTTHSPTAWANDPSSRGTENILYSCFNTLFLCAWTAFHPNMQSVDSKFWALLHRLRWMFLAIVLPEVVLFSAWSQWWAAKDLKDEVNRLGQQIPGPTRSTTFAKWERNECVACNPCKKLEECANSLEDPTIRSQKHENCECLDGFRAKDNAPIDTNVENSQHRDVHANVVDKPKAFAPWTMDQAFFVISGGVAIDTSLFWHRPYMSLTPKGIVLLAEIGLLPRFSKQHAQDRSRADAIAKSISCLQASWFFIQGVARVCAGLPLTLLELHTMTHIICALVMYAGWFSKPYGATSPMICSEPAMVNLAALLTLRCDTGRTCNKWSCAIKDKIAVRSVRCFRIAANGEEVSNENDEEVSNENDREVSNEDSEEVSNESDEVVSNENDEAISTHLDAANKAFDFLRERNIHLPFTPESTQSEKGFEFDDNFLVNNVSNIMVRGRFNNGVNKINTLLVRILILVFACLYCGSHLSAWNFHFPTVLEMWLWRGACFTMLCAPLFLHGRIVINPYGEFDSLDDTDQDKGDDNDQDRWDDRSAMDKTRIIFKYGWFLASLVLEKLFLFSRLYLLAESLANLRSPANGTYTSVDWTDYLPHFS